MKGCKHLPLSVLPPLPHFTVLGFHRLIRVTCPSLYGQGPYIPYFILSSLPYRFSFFSTIGPFPNAAHDLLCSFSGKSLICLCCSSVIPGTLVCPVVPGESTSASLVYLHAIFGLFQNALCMMVDTSSPAHARETAAPGCRWMEMSV